MGEYHTVDYMEEKYNSLIGIHNKDLSEKYKPLLRLSEEFYNWMDVFQVSDEEVERMGYNVLYWTLKLKHFPPFNEHMKIFREIIGDPNDINLDNNCSIHPLINERIETIILSQPQIKRNIKIYEILNYIIS